MQKESVDQLRKNLTTKIDKNDFYLCNTQTYMNVLDKLNYKSKYHIINFQKRRL